MKKMKKIAGLLLAVIMALAMTVTAYAANITINGGAEGSEYAAYKLLNATDGGDGKFAYTVNGKYLDVLKEVTGKNTDAEVIAYISELVENGTREFADSVYKSITGANPAKTADYTTTSNEFINVDQGYYLIAETKTGSASDTYSLVMLDTAGQSNIEVETKEDAPTLEKKVQEKNDSTGETTGWQDGADYDIGDDVPFKLTGTVSAKYDDYETYYYAFHDKMSTGLTFKADSVVVKVDGVEVQEEGNYTINIPGTEEDCTFEVVFDNLKTITGATVTSTSTITVEFNAKLNSGAVVGQPGNPNEAKLEYSNNPYGDEKGETPEDKVIVFTYKLNANKVDGENNALKGAGFTLYKFDSAKNDYVAVGNEIKGGTTFTFTGLDAGKYKLVESTVPAGYNKAEDIIFIIDAVYETDAIDPKLTSLIVKKEDGTVISGENLVFTTNVSDGSVNTNVVNNSGTELPSTGGMGTTIFYVVGSVLVLGAAVLLITKKRMSSQK